MLIIESIVLKRNTEIRTWLLLNTLEQGIYWDKFPRVMFFIIFSSTYELFSRNLMHLLMVMVNISLNSVLPNNPRWCWKPLSVCKYHTLLTYHVFDQIFNCCTLDLLDKNDFSPIQGEGDNGKPVVIPPRDMLIMQQQFTINRYNLLASDRMPLNRSLPDVRKKKWVF